MKHGRMLLFEVFFANFEVRVTKDSLSALTITHVTLPLVNGADFFVDKTGNSFEESVDLCIDVLKRKLEKHKEA